MKTLLSLIIALLLGFAGVATTLNHEPDPNDFDENNHYQTKTRSFGVGMFPKKDALVMNVLVDNYSAQRICVQLQDESGNIWFSQTLTKKQRRSWLKFNMSEMKDAIYKVVIFNKRDKVVKELNLRTLKVPLLEPKLEEQRLISMR